MIKVPSVGVLRYGACVAIVPRRGGREHYILPQVKRVRKLARKGTAGMAISKTHTKNQFASEPDGLRQFRVHRWKTLGEEKSDLPGPFSVIIV